MFHCKLFFIDVHPNDCLRAPWFWEKQISSLVVSKVQATFFVSCLRVASNSFWRYRITSDGIHPSSHSKSCDAATSNDYSNVTLKKKSCFKQQQSVRMSMSFDRNQKEPHHKRHVFSFDLLTQSWKCSAFGTVHQVQDSNLALKNDLPRPDFCITGHWLHQEVLGGAHRQRSQNIQNSEHVT